MSNVERQRKFRQRNPGYYASIQATRRASAKRGGKQLLAKLYAERAAALPAAQTPAVPVIEPAHAAPTDC